MLKVNLLWNPTNFILLFVIATSQFLCTGQIVNTYVTVQDGAYQDPSIWDIGISPPFNLSTTDSVVIKNIVSCDNNIDIEGVLMVEMGGVLDLIDNKLQVSKINSSYPIPFPDPTSLLPANFWELAKGRLVNDGIITTSGELHVDGFLKNTNIIEVGKIHHDGYICNSSLITLAPGEKLDFHGGVIDCCGCFYVDEIKAHKNNQLSGYDAPARVHCQKFSHNSGHNIIFSGVSELDFINNNDPTESLVSSFPDSLDIYTDCKVVLNINDIVFDCENNRLFVNSIISGVSEIYVYGLDEITGSRILIQHFDYAEFAEEETLLVNSSNFNLFEVDCMGQNGALMYSDVYSCPKEDDTNVFFMSNTLTFENFEGRAFVYNSIGQMIDYFQINGNHLNTIDCSHLSNGLYFILLENKKIKTLKMSAN